MALLLFHLHRENLLEHNHQSASSTSAKQERETIKAGLESLKEGTGGVAGLQTNLTTYITSLE